MERSAKADSKAYLYVAAARITTAAACYGSPPARQARAPTITCSSNRLYHPESNGFHHAVGQLTLASGNHVHMGMVNGLARGDPAVHSDVEGVRFESNQRSLP